MTSFGFWDGALIVLVGLQATALAYIPTARGRALVTALPIPFSLGALAVGTPVEAAHVVGVDILLLFALAVRLLHRRARWPIIPAIVASALGYGAAGAALKTIVPAGEPAFWIAALGTLLVAEAFRRWTPRGDEPDHHHPLPPWLKFPAVAGVIFALLLLKKVLGGFMALFPMVGVFAAYEGRYRLAAFGRAFNAFAFAVVPFLAVVRILQPRLGLAPALALGWLVHIPVLWLQIRVRSSESRLPAERAEEAAGAETS